MVSLKGRLFRAVVRRTLNLNSPDPAGRMRSVSAGALNDRVPRGFTMTKLQTPKGTKYERVCKTGAAKNGKVVYYLHGGGYVAGLLSTYRDFAADFHRSTGCETYYLDYSLAPEEVYPTQLEQALEVWDLLAEQYGPENIAVAGDSAGANLTLAMMLKLRNMGRPLPAAGLCISLWGDMTGSGASYRENYPRDVMFGRRGKACTDELLQELLKCNIYSFVGDADRTCPYVSPVYGEYDGFPPMFFTCGGHEMLLSDTLTVVEKLKHCGIPVAYDVAEGMFHTHAIFGYIVPEGKVSFQKLLNFLGSVFS